MPKRHFQVEGTGVVDPYALMLDSSSSAPDTLAHFISVRNYGGDGTVQISIADGSNAAEAPIEGAEVTPGGQFDLNVPAGLRYIFRSQDGSPCSDVFVIMVPAG